MGARTSNCFRRPMISCLREIFEFFFFHRLFLQLFINDVNNYSFPIADDFVPYKIFGNLPLHWLSERLSSSASAVRDSTRRKDSCLAIRNGSAQPAKNQRSICLSVPMCQQPKHLENYLNFPPLSPTALAIGSTIHWVAFLLY